MDVTQAAPRHLSAYSWRARLGLIVPPTNTVNEAEWSRLVPEGVTFHTMRMALHTDTASRAGQVALTRDLDQVIGLLTPARVDVVAYACTAGSMVSPPEAMPRAMEQRCTIPAVTTAAAIVAALRALGVHRLAVATPYHEALNAHETRFLTGCGFEVLTLRGLGIGAGGPQEYPRIAETPLADVAAHARGVVTPEAEALLITCTDFPTLPLIAPLEEELGIPVVSSNSATLWAALRLAGIDDAIPAGGRLLCR